MLPSTRNKLTMNILNKLRSQGAPKSSVDDSAEGQSPEAEGLMGRFDEDQDNADAGPADTDEEGTGAIVQSTASPALLSSRRKKRNQLPGSES